MIEKRNKTIKTTLNPTELEKWKIKVKLSGLTSMALLRYLAKNATLKLDEDN